MDQKGSAVVAYRRRKTIGSKSRELLSHYACSRLGRFLFTHQRNFYSLPATRAGQVQRNGLFYNPLCYRRDQRIDIIQPLIQHIELLF